MKRQNFLYLALGAAIALPACSSDETPVPTKNGVPVSDQVIKVRTDMANIQEGSFARSRYEYDDPKYGQWVDGLKK